MYTAKDIATLTSLKRKTNPYCVIKDHCFDDIIDSVHADVQALKDKIRPAKMSKARGQDEWEDETHRGDSICWITPQLCSELGLSALETFVQRMLADCGALQTELGLTPAYTCQFAVYPGKGEGYNRHKDAFSVQTTAPKDEKEEDDSGNGVSERPVSRQLTCLLYLNKDWVAEDGGQLRVFTHPGVRLEKGDDPFNFWGVNGYDVNPLFGRMIIFRSELVEHAVLPCFKERMALTFWMNGTGPVVDCIESTTSVFKFDANASKPDIHMQESDNDSSSDSDSSEDESANVEVIYEVNQLVEVKVKGLWVDGTVTDAVDSRYCVRTVSTSTKLDEVVTNKGRYELRLPGPKHFGTIHSKTAEEYDWVAFKAKWRDMSDEERGATESVVFGHNEWTCCGGHWNAPPCGRK
jgi:SM-20-related protein